MPTQKELPTFNEVLLEKQVKELQERLRHYEAILQEHKHEANSQAEKSLEYDKLFSYINEQATYTH